MLRERPAQIARSSGAGPPPGAKRCREAAVPAETVRVAVEAVRQACHVCQAIRQSLRPGDVTAKEGNEPVTVADYASQGVIALHLWEAFPDDRVVGEEGTDRLRSPDGARMRDEVIRRVRTMRQAASVARILAAIDRGQDAGGPEGRFWTLDPIDGTKGFLRGDHYAVALALVEHGEVQLGVLGCPEMSFTTGSITEQGSLFLAVRGGGARVYSLGREHEMPVRVSGVSDPRCATFCEPVEAAHASQGEAARIAKALGITQPPLRMDSQAKYAAVSRGEADIYLRLPASSGRDERIWDHAAGMILVEEAGGKVTDARGGRLDFSVGRSLRRNFGVVATNGYLHTRVLETAQRVALLDSERQA